MEKELKISANDVPRINKKVIKITSLTDELEEKQYWFSRTPIERFNAIEYNRRMVYGVKRTSSRLQRFLEVAELSQS